MFLRKFQASWPRKSQDVFPGMMKCILQFILLRFPILKASFWSRVSISDTVDAQTTLHQLGVLMLYFCQTKTYQKETQDFSHHKEVQYLLNTWIMSWWVICRNEKLVNIWWSINSWNLMFQKPTFGHVSNMKQKPCCLGFRVYKVCHPVMLGLYAWDYFINYFKDPY